MKLDKSFSPRTVPTSELRLAKTRAIVVGGTGGIGRAISRTLAVSGASVTVVGQTFRDADLTGVTFVQADLSLMRDAQRVAKLLAAETADLVVFTTGIFAAPQRQVTSEGIERDMAVSYLNRLVMLREVGPRLGADRRQGAPKARVFNMAYPGSGQLGTPGDLNAERSYKAFAVHMNTVAGNEMLVLDGVKRYPGLNMFGLNPGFIKTNIRSNFLGGNKLLYNLVEGLSGLITPSADQYAELIVPLLVSPDLDAHSGAMFDRKGRPIVPTSGLDAQYVEAFIAASTKLVAEKAHIAF